ncbi:MAG: hypothetical protein QXX68_01935 [Candidatus Pacearchaeota archaeon]
MASNTNLSYIELEKKFRHLIKDLIRSWPERYCCLDYRHHSKIADSMQDQKYRFGIIPRRDVSPRNTGHSFDCGHSRIELFLGGNFDERDLFVPNYYRWVFCPSLSTDFFVEGINEQFKEYWLAFGREVLFRRDFFSFVEGCLDIVQDNLAVLKDIISREKEYFF